MGSLVVTGGLLDRFFNLIREGHGPTHAAMECGVNYNTMMNTVRKDPELTDRLRDARAAALDLVEKQLIEMAKDGNLAAIKFVLTNRRSKKWKDGTPANPHTGATQVTINVSERVRAIVGNEGESRKALGMLVTPNLLTAKAQAPKPVDEGP